MSFTSNASFGPDVSLTEHSQARLQQRGIGKAQLLAFMSAFDRERPVGRGCMAVTVSKKARRELLAEGIPPALLDMIGKMAAVIGREGRIVTVAKQYGKRARVYRRGLK